jgi:hypothetical protein
MINAVVYSFRVSDVDDPDIWAGESLCKWETSEAGQWVIKHSVVEPSWHCHVDYSTYGYVYSIRASLTEKDYTFWKLKFE